MGEVRFSKGTEEWEVFTEFWNLCQKYWIPESTDSWWDEALGKIDTFSKKNGQTEFVRGLCMALINHLEVNHLEQSRQKNSITNSRRGRNENGRTLV